MPALLLISVFPLPGQANQVLSDNADTNNFGTTTGDYTDTHTSDDVCQEISEILGGWWIFKYSFLEHTWAFNVTGLERLIFNVEAHRTQTPGDRDIFYFLYSANKNGPYTKMLEVKKTGDNDTCQSYELPVGTSGTVYIRVQDSYRAYFTTGKDTIYIDHMYISSESSAMNNPPEAAVSAGPIRGITPLAVNFDESSSSDPDGTIVSYDWNFGDGNTGSGSRVSHTYNVSGIYTAVLTVTDDKGATDTGQVMITVTDPVNIPPTAKLAVNPTIGIAPLMVYFDGSTSTDPDGNLTSYEWDFGDGVIGSGVKVIHTYNSIGNYTATLTVTDDDHATDTDLLTITADSGSVGKAGKAQKVEPVDRATYVYKNTTLRWISGNEAVSYNVYFGSNVSDVANATPTTPDVFKGNQVEVEYSPGTMSPGMYYWRIDEVSQGGVTLRGDIRSFYVPGLLKEDLSVVDVDPFGEPVGGGAGYSRLIDESKCDITVETREALLKALHYAGTGIFDCIYVADDATIEMSDEDYYILIPGGVTLASGRGKPDGRGRYKKGGRIKKTELSSPNNLFQVHDADVRITGLRLEGPDVRPAEPGAAVSCDSYLNCSRGIDAFNNLEVDNCEVYHWGYEGILVKEESTARIHHNYMHDNWGGGTPEGSSGPGYAVEVEKGNPIIEANIFEWNRHNISGAGYEGCRYEARYNVALRGVDLEVPGINGQSFDMHGRMPEVCFSFYGCYTPYCWKPAGFPYYGCGDKNGQCDECLAGNSVNIHHNTFAWPDHYAVHHSGKPRDISNIHDNWFFHNEIGGAVDDLGAAATQFYNNGNFNIFNNMITEWDFNGIVLPPSPISQ